MAKSTKSVKNTDNIVEEVEVKEKSDIRRNDLYSINPYKITVREEDRGRFRPPTVEKIVEMAMSFHQNGQRSPVECRKKSKDEYILTFGFTRAAAGRLLREGFNDPITGEFIQNKNFMLKCVVADTNSEKALIHNIIENQHRNDTTPMDDAINHFKLRDNYGYSDSKITEIYQYSDPTKVGRYKKLLHLPTEIQILVHERIVPVSAALEALEADDETQKTIFADMLDKAENDVKIKATDIRQQIRSSVLNDDDREDETIAVNSDSNPDKKEKSKFKPLSVREVRVFYENLKEKSTDVNLQKFAEINLKFLSGRCMEKRMYTAIEELMNASKK